MSSKQDEINAEIMDRLDRLESQNAPGPRNHAPKSLPGNEFQFQDLAEGETFLWQGTTWRKVGPNHAESVDPFRQYIPANDAVDPVSDVSVLEDDDVESEPQHPEGEASRPDRPASISG